MPNIASYYSKSVRGYTTRKSHLEHLGENDGAAWQEFYDKYKAMIFAIGAARHLNKEECEDLMQEVALICSRKLQNFIYDPERCHFRSFLFKIATNVSFNLLRKKTNHQADVLGDDYAVVPELDIKFMQEYEQFLLDRSLLILKNSVSSESYLSFDMLFCQKLSIAEVVAKTGFSTSRLYTQKHRCLKKLRAIIQELIRELEIPPETVPEVE